MTYELTRIRLSDGWETTVYLVRHPLPETSVRVVWFPEPRRLDQWCAANDHPEAIVAGFFLRDPYRPLGEVRVEGAAIEHEPIASALGRSSTELLAVCCDGRRSGVDGGLDLRELARLLISFGAEEAINLDGGGSATLVHRGHLLNRPYSNQDQPAPESRPVVTALLFESTA